LIDLSYITGITAFWNLLKSSGTPCTNVPLFLYTMDVPLPRIMFFVKTEELKNVPEIPSGLK
jgi:hypothetical protein